MTDTMVMLGDFEFARFEVPEEIPFGGSQALVVHRLVGGTRVVDAMGEDPRAPEWSGFFVGENALERAFYVDGLRKAGLPLVLTWSELAYTVVIREFECRFVRSYRLPYRIVCEVVSDDTAPVTEIASPSPEQLVSDDMTLAISLGALIADPTLTGALSTLSTAIGGVGNFAAASPGTLSALLDPIGVARGQVSTLLTAATSAIDGSSRAASLVSTLAGNCAASSSLLGLDRTLGRMAINIGAVNAGTKTLATVGGNLFDLAAREYGSADGWTAIAQANGITDPVLAGIQTIAIPPLTHDSGGILG